LFKAADFEALFLFIKYQVSINCSPCNGRFLKEVESKNTIETNQINDGFQSPFPALNE